ncbi:MAG TPA: hypothetical protein VF505_06035 [Thermoanaerobaculia bacterium]
MRRLAILALFLLCFTAAFSTLFRYFTRRLEDFSGPARWIWAQHQISRNVPVVFFATRNFDMPPGSTFAHLKLFADPESTLWFNGREIASRRSDAQAALEVYDVTPLVRSRNNRIVVAVRSKNGVGGLIAAIDVSDERENVIVTDENWRIFRRWNDALPLHDIGDPQRPMVLGAPPLGRWHYLPPRPVTFDPPPMKVIEPKQTISYVATIPSVKIVDGVAVASKESVRATAFDFGFTRGRVRLTLAGEQPVPPVVLYRIANVKEEFGLVESSIWSTPFGDGEKTLTEPETRSFRYVIVFGGRARAEVVQ